jgi:hypothetical protein
MEGTEPTDNIHEISDEFNALVFIHPNLVAFQKGRTISPTVIP